MLTNLSLLHTMLTAAAKERWDCSELPCSVTSSSCTNHFWGLSVHTPCSQHCQALVFLLPPVLRHVHAHTKTHTHACACTVMLGMYVCSMGSFIFSFFFVLKRSYLKSGLLFHYNKILDQPFCYKRKIKAWDFVTSFKECAMIQMFFVLF